MLLDGNAQEARATFVFAYGEQGPAKRRAQKHGHDAHRCGEQGQHQIVEGRAIASDVDGGEAQVQRLTAPSGEAIVAASNRVPAEGDEKEHLTEGNRHHGEVNATQLDDQSADERGSQRSGSDAGQDAQWSAGHDVFERHADTVGAKSEIGGVPEGKHASESEQEVERHRRQAQHENAAAELRIASKRTHPVRHGEQQKPDEDCSCRPTQSAQWILPSSPSKPRGLTNSTTPIITYITASVAEGKNTVVIPEATPIRSPPRSVPGRLPSPPTMIATKLGMMSEVPIVGCSPSIPAASTPARPAR